MNNETLKDDSNGHIMLTNEQSHYFDTFGFLVLKDLFTSDEMKKMIAEFDIAVEHVNAYEPCGGTGYHWMSMLGDDTPFCGSILEDPRFLDIARQTFGEDLFGFMHLAYRYPAGGTEWHANDGSIMHSPNYGFGPKFQWPLHNPVQADTGALRVIPGSHRKDCHSSVCEAEKAGLLKDVKQVPSYACEVDPGDVVFFDSRIYHGTWSPPDGPGDRKVASIMYFKSPQTTEELAVMRDTADLYYKNEYCRPHQPWNVEPWKQWLANKPTSPIRQNRIDEMRTLSSMTDEQIGMRVERPKSGPAMLVPVETC